MGRLSLEDIARMHIKGWKRTAFSSAGLQEDIEFDAQEIFIDRILETEGLPKVSGLTPSERLKRLVTGVLWKEEKKTVIEADLETTMGMEYGELYSNVSRKSRMFDDKDLVDYTPTWLWFYLHKKNPAMMKPALEMANNLIRQDAEVGGTISLYLPQLAVLLPTFKYIKKGEETDSLQLYARGMQKLLEKEPDFADLMAHVIARGFTEWPSDVIDSAVKTSLIIYEKQGRKSAEAFLLQDSEAGRRFFELYTGVTE